MSPKKYLESEGDSKLVLASIGNCTSIFNKSLPKCLAKNSQIYILVPIKIMHFQGQRKVK